MRITSASCCAVNRVLAAALRTAGHERYMFVNSLDRNRFSRSPSRVF